MFYYFIKKPMKLIKNLLPLLLLVLTVNGCSNAAVVKMFIRANQHGYLPNDYKSGVIIAEGDITGRTFRVIDAANKRTAFSNFIGPNLGKYGKFNFSYKIDYSIVKTPGTYYIEIDGEKSIPFNVNQNLYNSVVDSLMLFFRMQRCGPTNPFMHEVCHLYDVYKIVGDHSAATADVTGGWHDAGDYIKFLGNSAYTTYMLMFSYEFDKAKFSFDNNHNGAPDVLEEAKVGLDWLLRCNYSKYKLITQVQDLSDHSVGWRLPEKDSLKYVRAGYTGLGKNQIGIYTAVMALASKIWRETFYDDQFADKCLTAAENIYSLRNEAPDVDKSQTGMYQDSRFWGKLSLGAVELYNTTKADMFLEDAKLYADSAKSDYWWSWGDINSLADYRIAKIESKYQQYILNNLSHFNKYRWQSLYEDGMSPTWGTTNSLLGVALQAILYKDLTGSNSYDSLAVSQRDFVLGKNNWGVSFVFNIGKTFSKYIHHQIGALKGNYTPGAIAAGPAPVGLLNNYKIERKNFTYDKFNLDTVKYYDDKNDYLTNEPTIGTNATAVFVFGYYSKR